MSAQPPAKDRSKVSRRNHGHKSSISEGGGTRRSSAAADDAGKRVSKSDATQGGGRLHDDAPPLSKYTSQPPDAPSSEQAEDIPAVSNHFPLPASSSSEQPKDLAAGSSQDLVPLASPSDQLGDTTALLGQVPLAAPPAPSSLQPCYDAVPPYQAPPPPAVLSPQQPENVTAVSNLVSPQVTSPQPVDVSAVSTQGQPLAETSSKPCDDGPVVPGPAFLPALPVPPVPELTPPLQGLAKYTSCLDAKAVSTLACTVCIAAAVLTTAMAYTGYRTGEGGWLCLTSDCAAHRRLLEAILNFSVDPCHDFDAFVCPRHETPLADAYGDDLSTSTLSSVRRRWLDGFGDLLEGGKELLAVGNKAAAMYASCMTHKPSTEDAVGKFLDMLKLRSINQREPVANVFGVLVEVAYNWQAPLWFRVAVFPQNVYHPFHRVLITRNPQMAEWQSALEGLNGTDKYLERWSATEGVNASANLILRSYNTRRAIFRMFSSRGASTTDSLRRFSLGNASNYVSVAIDMTQLLNDHIRPNMSLSKEDLMIFEEAHLLEVINAAFARFENGELVQHVLWLFRDVYGPIADPSLLQSQGHGSDAKKTRLRYCSSQVEASYHLLVNTLFALTRLTPLERQYIGELIRRIHQKAVQLIRDGDWLEWRSKSMAIAKLEGLSTLLWPPEEFLTDIDLSNIYRFFPDNASSFREYWMQTRDAIRNYTSQNPTGSVELFGAPDSYDEPIITYVHVLNTVFISMAALERPLFYGAGTRAINYGGLGYQYAREMVRALDRTGIGVDAYGSIVHRWISGLSATEYDKRVACLGPVHKDSFPDVPALDLSYRAYTAAVEKEGPKVFDEATETQIFFITMCLGMCGRQQGRKERACNKAVMAFRPFAEAFKCDKSSRMNLPEKCTFF